MITVIGIDLSLTSTGLAVINDGGIRLHRITSTGHKGDTLDQRRDRIRSLAVGITHRIPTGAAVAIEAPLYRGRAAMGSAHDRSWAWGKVVDDCHLLDATVVEIMPNLRSKYATGKGNASKDQVLAAACRRYPHVDIVGNDTADALILAAMLSRLLGQPIEHSLPATHLAALDKLPAVTPPQLDTSDGYGTADLIQAAHEAEAATC